MAQIELLATLLQLEQDLRQAESEATVEFIIVNETWRIVPYRQAILWRDNERTQQVKLVSGLADLSADSPYLQWLNQLVPYLKKQGSNAKYQLFSAQDLPENWHTAWQEWLPPHLLFLPFNAPQNKQLGGLLLAIEAPPSPATLALLERLAWSYGHALWAWRKQHSLRDKLRLIMHHQRRKLWLIILLLALFPMRLTVLAPAETVGKDAKLITAPMDGVVAQFVVKPNQVVQQGQTILLFDDTLSRNRYEVAEKARAVAQAEYLRATQKAFADEASKAELAALRAKVEEKTAEASYTKDLFNQVTIAAPANGVIIYSDPNDWAGRPVQTGERLAQLANPTQVEVAISLPVKDALQLDNGAEVKLYLNVSPLDTLDAKLTQLSYDAVGTPDGYVAYKLRASLNANQETPRIGLKGTAKIYGDWAPLIYHVLRKPWSTLRQTLGW